MKRQVFGVWFIIFIVWALYRAYFNFPEWIDEFLFKPLVFVAPVIYLTLVKEKSSLDDLGLQPKPRDFFLDLYIGIVIGILFALEGVIVNFFKHGNISFAPILALRASGGIIFFLISNLFTSLWEEILGRGYIYSKLYQAVNNQFKAALTSSFLFLLLHIPIMFTRLHLMGSSLIVYPLSILLLGIVNSYVYSLRGSLVLPILIHTFWNLTVALYL